METEDAWRTFRTRQSQATTERLNQLGVQFGQLFDLSEVPQASRRQVRADTTASLLDIIGRLELPPLDSVPGADAFADLKTPAKWRIPEIQNLLFH